MLAIDQVHVVDTSGRSRTSAPCRCGCSRTPPACDRQGPRRRRAQAHARFQALAAHYVFEPCFARPRTGHDKGGVEHVAALLALSVAHVSLIERGARSPPSTTVVAIEQALGIP